MESLVITGSRGSAARLMIKYLKELETSPYITGLCRSEQYKSEYESVLDITCDLNDAFNTNSTIKYVIADYILHLASNADVKSSWDQPSAVIDNNIKSTINLLEALRFKERRPKLIICSTSEVYGIVDQNKQPIKEDCQLNPINPYAVSKLAQDMLGKIYYEAYDVPIIRTRMFGYINPDRSNLFASAFARQIVLIENNQQKSLLHGNLNSSRTLLDHRDVASAYWAACQFGKPGEVYNIGSEQSVKVGEVLERLCYLSKCKIDCKEHKDLLRPIDIEMQTPDVSKFKEHTGWSQKYNLDNSLVHLLDYWRRKINEDNKRSKW